MKTNQQSNLWMTQSNDVSVFGFSTEHTVLETNSSTVETVRELRLWLFAFCMWFKQTKKNGDWLICALLIQWFDCLICIQPGHSCMSLASFYSYGWYFSYFYFRGCYIAFLYSNQCVFRWSHIYIYTYTHSHTLSYARVCWRMHVWLGKWWLISSG